MWITPGLTRTEIDHLKRRLTQQREEFVRIIHDGLVETQQSDYVDLAAQVHDAGEEEESVAHLLTDLKVSRLTRETEELQDIQAALTRIEDRTYGECIDCGAPIGIEYRKDKRPFLLNRASGDAVRTHEISHARVALNATCFASR